MESLRGGPPAIAQTMLGPEASKRPPVQKTRPSASSEMGFRNAGRRHTFCVRKATFGATRGFTQCFTNKS